MTGMIRIKITARWLVPLLLPLSAAQASVPIKEDNGSPQAVIRAFYRAIANNQPDKAAALFSFKLLELDDAAQIAAFRKELQESFAEEFNAIAQDYPKVELIRITRLDTLPDELAPYKTNCHAFKIDDSISEKHGGVEWSLCNENNRWKIMFLLSTE